MTLLFGYFPLEENFRFEHPGIFSCEWNSIFRNLRKRSHPREVYQKVGKSLTGNFRSNDFLSASLGWVVQISEIQQFSDFPETFQRCFRTISFSFDSFGIFSEMERARRIPKFSQISYWEFQFHLVFLLDFPEFLVEFFSFRKFRIFPYQLPPFWNFQFFLVKKKVSLACRYRDPNSIDKSILNVAHYVGSESVAGGGGGGGKVFRCLCFPFGKPLQQVAKRHDNLVSTQCDLPRFEISRLRPCGAHSTSISISQQTQMQCDVNN